MRRSQTAREDEMSLRDVCRDHLVCERTELFCSLFTRKMKECAMNESSQTQRLRDKKVVVYIVS